MQLLDRVHIIFALFGPSKQMLRQDRRKRVSTYFVPFFHLPSFLHPPVIILLDIVYREVKTASISKRRKQKQTASGEERRLM